jgi:hypothetical protein
MSGEEKPRVLNGVVHAEEMRFAVREVHLLVLGEEMVKGRGGTFHGPPNDEVWQAVGLLSGNVSHSEEGNTNYRESLCTLPIAPNRF